MTRASSDPCVAVVDDDESVRRALGRLIRAFGYETEVFASGEAFLATLAGRRPNCVILDLHMPGIDGFETQARLAKSSVGVPAVIITGHDTAEAQARALALGAAAYLRKPIDARTLLETIREALRETGVR